MDLTLKINGEKRTINIDPGEILLDTLRKTGLYSPKRACSTGDCGACVILLDGEPVNSCLVFSASVQGKEVMTVEGLGTVSNPHPLQKHFVQEGAVQCGFCIPGILISAKALIDKNNNPTEEDVKQALNGHICRCTGYVKQVKAVIKAAAEMRGEA